MTTPQKNARFVTPKELDPSFLVSSPVESGICSLRGDELRAISFYMSG